MTRPSVKTDIDTTDIMDAFYREQKRQEDEREKILWDRLDRSLACLLLDEGTKD